MEAFQPEWRMLGEIVGRTLVVYLFLVVALKLAGKREIGQMTTFDLVVVLIIANAVQNAMVGPNTSLEAGLVAAGTLLVANHGVSWLRAHVPFVARWLGGVPTPIIENGKLLPGNLAKELLGEDEVLMALREHGIERLDQVERASLEPDGSISVIPRAHTHLHRRRRRVRILKKET